VANFSLSLKREARLDLVRKDGKDDRKKKEVTCRLSREKTHGSAL